MFCSNYTIPVTNQFKEMNRKWPLKQTIPLTNYCKLNKNKITEYNLADTYKVVESECNKIYIGQAGHHYLTHIRRIYNKRDESG